MDQAESIENISGCFRTLSKEDISIFNDQKTQVSFLKGETIFKQGAFASSILFINKGLAMVYLQLGRDKQINIQLAGKGDYLSFSTVFDSNTYQYSAVAMIDTVICMIEKEAFKNVILKNGITIPRCNILEIDI